MMTYNLLTSSRPLWLTLAASICHPYHSLPEMKTATIQMLSMAVVRRLSLSDYSSSPQVFQTAGLFVKKPCKLHLATWSRYCCIQISEAAKTINHAIGLVQNFNSNLADSPRATMKYIEYALSARRQTEPANYTPP